MRSIPDWASPPHLGNPSLAAVGYLVFATGTLVGLCLTWLMWKPNSDDNPLAVLLLVWVIAGITHMVVRMFLTACIVSAFASVLGYFVLALAISPDPLSNPFFVAGMIEVGLFAFVFSMVMGIPVVIYRRARNARTEERSTEQR